MASKQPKTTLHRSVRLLLVPTPARSGALRITIGGRSETYLFSLIPSQWGEGFNFRKLEDDPARQTSHDVHLSAAGRTCDCRGFQFRGSCKHVDAVVTLRLRGLLSP